MELRITVLVLEEDWTRLVEFKLLTEDFKVSMLLTELPLSNPWMAGGGVPENMFRARPNVEGVARPGEVTALKPSSDSLGSEPFTVIT